MDKISRTRRHQTHVKMYGISAPLMAHSPDHFPPASNDNLRGRCLDCGEDRPLPDAALAARLGSAPLDADVALLAEAGPPRVLDLPILLAIVRTVADGEHAVVQVFPASLVGEYAPSVVLED